MELLIQIIEEFSSLFPNVPRLRDAWVPHREKILQLAEKSRTCNIDLQTLLDEERDEFDEGLSAVIFNSLWPILLIF